MAFILLPGDTIDPNLVPTSPKRRLGTGILESLPPNTFTSTLPGSLHTTTKPRPSASIPAPPHSDYIAQAGDLVIAQISRSSADFFHCTLSPHSPVAMLPQLAFEGATKKTRPMLKTGDLVYAKVTLAKRGMELELSCVNPGSGKAEGGMGPLNGGTVWDVSSGFAERLLDRKNGGVVVLEVLGEKLRGGFEVAVGRNGRVWVDCPGNEGVGAGIKGMVAVGRCLKLADDGGLTEKEQRRCVGRVLSELGIS